MGNAPKKFKVVGDDDDIDRARRPKGFVWILIIAAESIILAAEIVFWIWLLQR